LSPSAPLFPYTTLFRSIILQRTSRRGIMFVRQERSMKEFMQFYPVVSTIIIINLLLWLIINVLQLQIGEIIYSWSVGSNYLVSRSEEHTSELQSRFEFV